MLASVRNRCSRNRFRATDPDSGTSTSGSTSVFSRMSAELHNRVDNTLRPSAARRPSSNPPAAGRIRLPTPCCAFVVTPARSWRSWSSLFKSCCVLKICSCRGGASNGLIGLLDDRLSAVQLRCQVRECLFLLRFVDRVDVLTEGNGHVLRRSLCGFRVVCGGFDGQDRACGNWFRLEHDPIGNVVGGLQPGDRCWVVE